jgi:prophage tail gpP-like protein
MNDVSLHVNGREWSGWTSVRVSAGIERIARDFSVELTRRWPGDNNTDSLRLGVRNGDRVTVMLDSDPVITGYVEATPVTYDAQSVSMGIAGRSLTADLIDCAAAPTQFDGRSMYQIATALAQPFGISVIDAGAPTAPLLGLQVDHAETVVEVINKMLGIQQALVYDDERGQLVIGMPGATHATTALVYGQNILKCSTEKSIRERFSAYDVTGQRPGNNQDFGQATIAAIRSQTVDAGIARYRPMIIRQTGTATTQTCKERAEFEMLQRAARTDETTYTVQGWRQGDGQLWKPNQRVIVFDPLLGFQNDELLISEVSFTKSNSGTTTELRIGPADAYMPEPSDPTKSKRTKKQRVNPFL